jgi:D-alanyl-D-alanine carboxypeptidase
MKSKHLLVIAVLIFLLNGSSIYADPELPYAKELQNALDSTRQLTNVMGVSVAIIVPGYEPWLGVSGESYPGQPITSGMLFDMGSISKLILSALVLDLYEDSLLSLDEPVGKYLPPYPNVDGSITIQQLLNHTNGLYDMVTHPQGPFRKPYNTIDFEKWWTISEIFTTLGGKPYFPPGGGFHYTQAGYQIATLIIEKVTHSTVPVEVQKRLLDPLGINGMLLDFSRPIPDSFTIAHPWVDTDSDGVPEDVYSKSRNWIASLSRILFYTRAEDLAVWTHALFMGNVLQPQYLDGMLTFVHPKQNEIDNPLFIGYGLGVMEINPQMMRGQRTMGHLGSIPGYRAFTSHLVDCGVTMVILYNSDTDKGGMSILDGLLVNVLKNGKK